MTYPKGRHGFPWPAHATAVEIQQWADNVVTQHQLEWQLRELQVLRERTYRRQYMRARKAAHQTASPDLPRS